MALVYMIRHGRAAASWDEDLDPGLDDTGHAQAAGMAEAMAPLGPLPILLSPLKRTRETAAPLETLWAAGTVEPRVAEVPSPDLDLGERREWLNRADDEPLGNGGTGNRNLAAGHPRLPARHSTRHRGDFPFRRRQRCGRRGHRQ